MQAANEKKLNRLPESIVNEMDSEPARIPATKTTASVVNRIAGYDFRTRKFKKSPIGTSEKIRIFVLVEKQRSPRKRTGENALQLRRSHWAPELSLYRGYFVPSETDPQGKLKCAPDEVYAPACCEYCYKCARIGGVTTQPTECNEESSVYCAKRDKKGKPIFTPWTHCRNNEPEDTWFTTYWTQNASTGFCGTTNSGPCRKKLLDWVLRSNEGPGSKGWDKCVIWCEDCFAEGTAELKPIFVNECITKVCNVVFPSARTR